MKKEMLYEAIGTIHDDYIQSAHAPQGSRRSVWIRWGMVAACLCLLLPMAFRYINPDNIPAGIDPNINITVEDLDRPYRAFTLQSADMAVAWQWKYLTIYEKYPSIDIDGVRFIRMGEEIDSTVVGQKTGTYEAIGYNAPYETPIGGYRESFDAYTIQNVSPDCMVAFKMEDRYFCYISDAARAQLRGESWGEVLEKYGLDSAIKFDSFSKHEAGRETEYFLLEEDAYIWEVLDACRDAPAVDPSQWKNDGDYYSFTVTSDTFGIYKKALYVTKSGYVWTNILEVECIYNIGKEAAEKILTYALDNAEKTRWEPYHQTVVGTITEITDAYILVDDSVLCKEAGDGIAFKIMRNDLRINRYVDDNRVKVGDLVQIIYTDSIDTANGYGIDSAISAEKVLIFDNRASIPE